MKIVLTHGWIGVGKSTRHAQWFETWAKQNNIPAPYTLIRQHNTDSSDTLEILDCFYQGKISKLCWETHQLIVYWKCAMAALRNHPSQGLIFDRSFFDVHSFMALYLSHGEYNQLLPLYNHLVDQFMKICVEKKYIIQPIIITKPAAVAWRQFTNRNRSAEVHAFTQDAYIHHMQRYEEATVKTMDVLRTKFGCDIIMPTKMVTGITVDQSVQEFDAIMGCLLTL